MPPELDRAPTVRVVTAAGAVGSRRCSHRTIVRVATRTGVRRAPSRPIRTGPGRHRHGSRNSGVGGAVRAVLPAFALLIVMALVVTTGFSVAGAVAFVATIA